VPDLEKPKEFQKLANQFWPYVTLFPERDMLIRPIGRFVNTPIPEKQMASSADPAVTAVRVSKVNRALSIGRIDLGTVAIIGVKVPSHFMEYDAATGVGNFYNVDTRKEAINLSWRLLDVLNVDNDAEMLFLSEILKEALRSLMIKRMLAKLDLNSQGEWVYLLTGELGEFNRQITGHGRFWTDNKELIEKLRTQNQNMCEREIRPRVDELRNNLIPKLETGLFAVEGQYTGNLRDEEREKLRFAYLKLIGYYNELAFLEERMSWPKDARESFLRQIVGIVGIQLVDWPGLAPAKIQDRKVFVYLWAEDYPKFLKALHVFLTEGFRRPRPVATQRLHPNINAPCIGAFSVDR
jgi:hypothetical protein